jgi:hypothetical protein
MVSEAQIVGANRRAGDVHVYSETLSASDPRVYHMPMTLPPR